MTSSVLWPAMVFAAIWLHVLASAVHGEVVATAPLVNSSSSASCQATAFFRRSASDAGYAGRRYCPKIVPVANKTA